MSYAQDPAINTGPGQYAITTDPGGSGQITVNPDAINGMTRTWK